MNDYTEKFMGIALAEAETAFSKGEIPVGAVIVRDNEVIARAHNINRAEQNPVLHAEIIAIQKASSFMGNERLVDCDIYITKEPCAMCAGAIVHARLRRVIIAARDSKYGACGTVFSICGNGKLNHVPDIEFGILEDKALRLLKDFFQGLRNK